MEKFHNVCKVVRLPVLNTEYIWKTFILIMCAARSRGYLDGDQLDVYATTTNWVKYTLPHTQLLWIKCMAMDPSRLRIWVILKNNMLWSEHVCVHLLNVCVLFGCLYWIYMVALKWQRQRQRNTDGGIEWNFHTQIGIHTNTTTSHSNITVSYIFNDWARQRKTTKKLLLWHLSRG